MGRATREARKPNDTRGTKGYRKRKDVYCDLSGLSILLFHHLEAVVFKFTGVEERDYSGGPPSFNYLNPDVPSTESSGQN